jgi:uncharacterized LabA/DUF88 family protein
MNERSRRVVLLIDYDNLQICASRDTPGRDLQLTPVVQLAQRYGTVILARAYAEWNLSTERLAVYKAGIEPAFAPVLRTESDRSGKSLADTVMVAEGMDMLWTLSPDVVVLATSDKDLIPLVRVAKQRGAFVVVLGSDFTAIPLREMADEHITYRQVITDASGRFATEAGPGRQPAALPEPSRRRRDRNGRERAGATPAATASPAAPSPQRAEREPAPPQRAEREPAASPQRAEREPAAAEPVAPVGAGTVAENESQVGTRRRRRRGSRRRLERLGGAGEAAAAGEPSNGAAATTPGEVEEITPTTSAVDEAEAASAVGAAEAGSEAVAPEPAEAEPPLAEPAAPEAVEAPAAPRERRRRTRRTPAAAAAETPAAETPAAETPATAGPADQGPSPDVATGVPATAASTSDVPPDSADVLPAPEPASANGEEPTAAPRPRPRRVASASRGRTRRV